MAIYTKKGDRGETSIIGKKKGETIRISKASALIDTIGAIDEANSYLGIVAFKLGNKSSQIKEIQRSLFTIGSILAGANILPKGFITKKLELDIDRMDRELPKLTNFIIPGGSEISSHLMYARVLVRKAERRIVFLTQHCKFKFQGSILVFMNRLSDYLFVLARWVNNKNKVKETEWKPK